jgi:acetyl-CoA C-acetyltransferase
MSIYIYDAVRTPRGKGRRGGSLAEITPAQLVGQLVRALERRIGPDAVAAIEHFTLGSVTQVGAQGGHLALAARIQAGLPDGLPCLTINNFCVSGLSAIADAARRVASGQVDLALAGGVESMSRVAFMTDAADYYADMPLAASMGWAPVGVAADLLATREGVERPAMDAAVLRSHARAAKAWSDGRYDGRVIPIMAADGSLALGHDENIRDYGDGAALSRLAPVFAETGSQGFDDILLAHRPEIGTGQAPAHRGPLPADLGRRVAGAGGKPRGRRTPGPEAVGPHRLGR